MLKTVENISTDYYPYGKVLREYQPKAEKYITTHHERDTETGLDYRGARYYDADVARFLSLDPAAMQFPTFSAYNYVAGNPIMFIDPDGRIWKPYLNTKNQLVATKEEGDTEASLQTFLGSSYSKEQVSALYSQIDPATYNDEVNLGELGGSLGKIAGALVDGKVNKSKYVNGSDENFNCHTCAHNTVNAKDFLDLRHGDEGFVPNGDKMDAILQQDYKSVTKKDYQVGKTLIRMVQKSNDTYHYHTAVYMGTGQDGTVYVAAKQGTVSKTEISTLERETNRKGDEYEVKGINEEDTGFYNPK